MLRSNWNESTKEKTNLNLKKSVEEGHVVKPVKNKNWGSRYKMKTELKATTNNEASIFSSKLSFSIRGLHA